MSRIGGFVVSMRTIGVTSALAVVLTAFAGVPAAGVGETESSYIVELAPSEARIGISSELVDESAVTETFDSVMTGFSAELTPSEVEELESNPGVLAVYEDLPLSVAATQADAPWNLSRLDQDSPPADAFYTYPDSAGAGARIYVVDTGVSANAAQFGARLLPGFTAISDGRGSADCNGHGSHVAGIAASATYGVAKLSNVVSVRVFGCTGNTLSSTVVSGLDWITANHPAGTPGIVNLSLVSSSPIDPTTPDALTNAVNNMASQGFIMVVAAGNENANACNYTPSRAASALTVAATTSTDTRASYSSYGSCVDLFAPGSSIRSLQWDNPSGSTVKSGTSMAAPHVAGVAALALAESPGASAGVLQSRVLQDAEVGRVSDPRGSPNLLASITPGSSPAPGQPAADESGAVYRFWSDAYNSHFYTRSVAERNNVYTRYPNSVWRYEGPVFGAYGTQVAGSIPVYRFWSATYNAHFYTASEAEKNRVIAIYPSSVWKYEAIAFYAFPSSSDEPGTRLMSRFWSPTYLNHFFTASPTEAEKVKTNYPASIWTFEGTPFRVPSSYVTTAPLP